MRSITAGLALLLVSLPAMAQVWKGEVPDAAKVAAMQKAAARGDAAAMADVAYLSRYCRGGVKYDPRLIYEYSRKSAKAGNAFGMAGLSYCYMQGCGVDADDKEAYRWAKKSADLKHACGLFRLSCCYEKGHGVPIDLKIMSELREQADDMGSVNARYAEAASYYHGVGVDQDRDKALDIANSLVRDCDWIFAAGDVVVDHGREKAGRQAFDRAFACLSRHAALGHPHADRMLAHYQRDNGMLDDESFLHRIIESARQGDRGSCGNLSAYVEDREYRGYDLPVYATEGTYRDLGVILVARGLNIHTNKSGAWRAIDSHANGGDVFPRNLEAARDIAQWWVLSDPDSEGSPYFFHLQMAYIYQRGVSHKVKGFEREDLAVAHAMYGCATDAKCMKWLQYFNRGYFPGFKRDIAKAYVTAKLAHEMKDDYTIRENIVKRIEVQLKEADWKEIRRLQDDGYPTAPKFREEARKLILASGFKLPEEKPEADPDDEDLKQ